VKTVVNEKSRWIAIPGLVKALEDKDIKVRSGAARALWSAAEKGDREIIFAIIREMDRLINSRVQSRKNDVFIRTFYAALSRLEPDLTTCDISSGTLVASNIPEIISSR
jgi:HEAT repeat protein